MHDSALVVHARRCCLVTLMMITIAVVCGTALARMTQAANTGLCGGVVAPLSKRMT